MVGPGPEIENKLRLQDHKILQLERAQSRNNESQFRDREEIAKLGREKHEALTRYGQFKFNWALRPYDKIRSFCAEKKSKLL